MTGSIPLVHVACLKSNTYIKLDPPTVCITIGYVSHAHIPCKWVKEWTLMNIDQCAYILTVYQNTNSKAIRSPANRELAEKLIP